MTNIFDYLLWRGDLPLSQTPFNQVDGAVLARLSYLPFEHVMEQESGTPVRVDTACRALLAWPNIQAIAVFCNHPSPWQWRTVYFLSGYR